MQGIYDAVSDKIRELFHDADLAIRILDPDTQLVEFKYLYDRGQRITVDPIPVVGVFAHILKTRETLASSRARRGLLNLTTRSEHTSVRPTCDFLKRWPAR